jgi:hypothetical protein
MQLGRRVAELSGAPIYYGAALTARVHAAAGRWRACVSAYDSIPASQPGARYELAVCRAHLGDTAGARTIMDQLLARRYTDRALLAGVQLALGDREGALASLEQAVEDRSSNLISIRALPMLAPLRGDPRFLAVLQRVGLPPHGPPVEGGAAR